MKITLFQIKNKKDIKGYKVIENNSLYFYYHYLGPFISPNEFENYDYFSRTIFSDLIPLNEELFEPLYEIKNFSFYSLQQLEVISEEYIAFCEKNKRKFLEGTLLSDLE